MTEGGHRHVLHPKLKVAGTWIPDKAHDIAQLRFFSSNDDWEKPWTNKAA